MVREIVHVQVGQCGNQIGNAFWNTMSAEHYLEKDGKFKGNKDSPEDALRLEKIGVYFREAETLGFVPRAVLVDSDPGTLDVIKASPMGSILKSDNFVFGASGTGNNWAKGHKGAELIDQIVDVIRHEAESCDFLQGFQITHSVCGGTGGGLGTLLLMKIRDFYPDLITSTFSIYPSLHSYGTVEPCNVILSNQQLLENSDTTFVIDNEALYNILQNIMKQKEPTYSDLNWVVSLAMTGITAPLRFNCKLNGDLSKMHENLIPFPRLHFLAIAQAPLYQLKGSGTVQISLGDITDQIWSPHNFLVNIQPQYGKYLSASCSYRGDLAELAVNNELDKIEYKLGNNMQKWIPKNFKTSLIRVPPKDTPMSGTLGLNTTSLKQVFQRSCDQFAKISHNKALHSYEMNGYEMKLEEANKDINVLINQYNEKDDTNKICKHLTFLKVGRYTNMEYLQLLDQKDDDDLKYWDSTFFCDPIPVSGMDDDNYSLHLIQKQTAQKAQNLYLEPFIKQSKSNEIDNIQQQKHHKYDTFPKCVQYPSIPSGPMVPPKPGIDVMTGRKVF